MSGLKEFLYVDVDRTRSLLAQLAGGIVEATKEGTASSVRDAAEAALLGLGPESVITRGDRREESRSMQELTFSEFERRAESEGFITDLNVDVADPSRWESGEVQSSLTDGEILRIESAVQVIDGDFFQTRVERFGLLAESMVKMNAKPGTSKASNASVEKQISDMFEGFSRPQLLAVASAVTAFVGDTVSVRILPCGIDYLEFGFTGALLARREYMQQERESLFSRYGQAPSRWISVFQVAAVPRREVSTEPPDSLPSVNPQGQINRGAMERMASGVMGFMEDMGLVEGPLWPSVSVTPLAIYRLVPKRP